MTDCIPSLVPLKVKEDYILRMTGLSLKNVELTVRRGKKILYRDFGEMMFTHTGVTGPLILSASAKLGKYLAKGEELSAFIDLKPALSPERLDERILREFENGKNKQFKNVIGVLFPSSLTPVMLEIGGIPGDKVIHEISREERLAFGTVVKNFPFTITEPRIQGGGHHTGRCFRQGYQPGKHGVQNQNLYFTGEVLDLDAVTGATIFRSRGPLHTLLL